MLCTKNGRAIWIDRWIVVADSVRTSNIRDHARDQTRKELWEAYKRHTFSTSSQSDNSSDEESDDDVQTDLLTEWDNWMPPSPWDLIITSS